MEIHKEMETAKILEIMENQLVLGWRSPLEIIHFKKWADNGDYIFMASFMPKIAEVFGMKDEIKIMLSFTVHDDKIAFAIYNGQFKKPLPDVVITAIKDYMSGIGDWLPDDTDIEFTYTIVPEGGISINREIPRTTDARAIQDFMIDCQKLLVLATGKPAVQLHAYMN